MKLGRTAASAIGLALAASLALSGVAQAGTTKLVQDLVKGSGSDGALVPTAVGNPTFFAARPSPDLEPWMSTGRGGFRVADISPGGIGSHPNRLTAVGDRLPFTADDGVHGRERWM